MNVLFPVSEIAKVYHLGGLGNVAYSLPKALSESGIKVRVALPLHIEIDRDENWELDSEINVRFDNKNETVKVWKTVIPDTEIPLYLFDNDNYLHKHSGVGDEATTKFGFFSLAICVWLLSKKSQWQPDIIHLNDWHVSLIPLVLKHRFNVKKYKTLLTIHNLNFQGTANEELIYKLNIDPYNCKVLTWDKSDGDINFLMEGIIHTDWVNTVSETYAKEILTDEFGAFLNPIIKSLTGKLSGILNGIDYDEWNSETDPLIFNFSEDNLKEGKRQNKLKVQEVLDFEKNEDKLLVSFIGRVDPRQKGVQLIIEALKDGVIGNQDVQFAFLGTGDENLESQLQEIAYHNPNVSATCKFDNDLAHKIYASSDLTLIPSAYEPCGLVQMIAMRYGTVPIVRKTGGLADSVVENETGFLFEKYESYEFINKIKEVLAKFKNKNELIRMQINCYKKDFSWDKSAKDYIKLYKKLLSY